MVDTSAPMQALANGLREISGCEVCGNDELIPVLDLGLHPMCDDLVAIGESRACREYPIDIRFCRRCLTAHQRFQIPKQELFPSTYHYRSRQTADVLSGMQELVSSCERRVGGLAGLTILDIGCNDGSLLDFFVQKGARTVGIEPTGAADDAKRKGHQILNAFLSEEAAQQIIDDPGRPDIVTFTNVFAHIENLAEVVASLKRLIGPKTLLVIENHYLGAILEGGQFDTFYHEHPRTYSITSFDYIARSLGMSLLDVEFPARYGGNIRVFLGNEAARPQTNAKLEQKRQVEKQFPHKFQAMRDELNRWRVDKRRELMELARRDGKIAAKAFPGRAAILVKLLGLTEDVISAVYEKPGSMKIGHYVPGSRIPIRSDDDLFAQSTMPRVLLNLAWHIPGEIRSYMRQRGYEGEIIDIVDGDLARANTAA